MKNNIQKLPDAELDVMLALWDIKAPALRCDIEKALDETHPMAHTTLLTLLSRLGEKGFIEIKKEGRASTYSPLIKKDEYLSMQGENFFSKICRGKLSDLATALSATGITQEDFLELKKLIEESER